MLKRIKFYRDVLPVAVISFACVSLPTLAVSSADLRKSVQHCAEISKDAQRLACFDALIPSFAITSVEPVIATALVKKPSAALVETESSQRELKAKEEKNFAKEHLEKTAEQKALEVNSIKLIISQLKQLMHGEWNITFENDQKWQQSDNTRIKLKVGDNVVIEKGALGVFYLKEVGSNKRIRVKRLK